MLKWMIRFYFFTYFLHLKLVNINCENQEENQHNFNQINIELEPKKTQIKYLNYSNYYQFSFKENNGKDDLLIHFHSIDCNINIINFALSNIKIKKIKKDIFSIFIKKDEIEINSVKLSVEPLMNLGDNDKYKDLRICPIVINSLYKNDFQIDIEEQKEYMAFNFDENLPYVELLYKMENFNNNIFFNLSFIFDEQYSFNVEINNKQ